MADRARLVDDFGVETAPLLNDAVLTALNGIRAADLAFVITAVLDALPVLPSDPAAYPTNGGLFRDGDANGYRIVRILPAS